MFPSERASYWVVSTLPFRIFPTSKFHFPCSLKTPKAVNRTFPPSRRDSIGCPLNKSSNYTARLHNNFHFAVEETSCSTSPTSAAKLRQVTSFFPLQSPFKSSNLYYTINCYLVLNRDTRVSRSNQKNQEFCKL